MEARGENRKRERLMCFLFAWLELEEDEQYLLPRLLCSVFLELILKLKIVS